MARSTAERMFTPIAIVLVLLTALIDPVYSVSIASVLLLVYALVAKKTRIVMDDARLNAVVAVISAVAAVGFVFLRRWLDLPPAVQWAVIAFLIATLIWRLRHRSPYRARKDDLHLR